MKASERAFLVACAGLIGAALGYALPLYARLPDLLYEPIARRFYVGLPASPIPIGYYGQILYGLGGATATAVIALAATRGGAAAKDVTIGLYSAWALTAVALVAAYFTWNNWP